MQITINKSIETKVTIPVPSFWKNPSTAFNEYTAILDENTVANVVLMDDVCWIKNGTAEMMQSAIKEAYNNFHPCTESVFMSAYDEALQGMSLVPVEKTLTDSLFDVMGNGKETNY